MRAPRYRFPEEVRTVTRRMASRMVRDGTFPNTPDELEAYIQTSPEYREPLERGGYGSRFTARDLHPLLEVFAAQRGGAPQVAPGAPRRSWLGWVVGIVLAIVVLTALLLTVGADALSLRLSFRDGHG